MVPRKNDEQLVEGSSVSSSTADNTPADISQALADSHEKSLSQKQLLLVFSGMALGLLISFIDQTGITVALPYIARDLNAADTISWAGTASLISNTVFMVLFGRFSDIFSRKYVLIASMLLLAFFDLACGFAQNANQIFIFRGFCGIGNGGITSLTMVVVSDLVTLEDRGKYQGILGACVGIGNAIGPILASSFISHTSWRNFYYMMCPIVCLAALVVFWLVPYTMPDYTIAEKLRRIDYLGFIFSSIAIIFLLIPISGGGSFYSWSSPLVISMLTIGGLSLIIFVVVEKRLANLPMIPLHLFTMRKSLTFLLSQNFFFGMCYYSSLYYYPFYFEIVRGEHVITTSLYLLCLVIPQSFTSIVTGQIISRSKHYIHVIWFGYILWTLAVGLTIIWGVKKNLAVCIVTLILNGLGVGATFQPTLVAAQSQSYKKDRAIVISTRNVLRSFGGAVGLAVSSNLVSNSYSKLLQEKGSSAFSQEEMDILKHQIFSTINLEKFSPSQILLLRNIFMQSLRYVFYFWIASMSYCLITTITVKDRGLVGIEEELAKEHVKSRVVQS